MKLSNKQKAALEKISGKYWYYWHPEAVEAYFAFTDRGKRTPLLNRVWKLQLPNNKFNEKEQALWDLMQYHTFHPYTIECWKEDFRNCLLSPWEFFGSNYPDAYIKHILEVYKEARGYIPIDEVSGCKEEAERLGVEICYAPSANSEQVIMTDRQ